MIPIKNRFVPAVGASLNKVIFAREKVILIKPLRQPLSERHPDRLFTKIELFPFVTIVIETMRV